MSLEESNLSTVYHLNTVDKLYHICIGCLPVLCLFNVPVLKLSLGTIILIGFIPHSILYLLRNSVSDNYISSFPFLILYSYMIFRADGSITRIILCFAAFINLWGITKGSIEISYIKRVMVTFALINVALVFLQVIFYYFLHRRLQFLPKTLIHSQYKESFVFQRSNGLYRPTGLFLEPAHFSEYCCFALISVLFPPKKEKPEVLKAIFIILGCIFTTSGMGILLSSGIFIWYIIFGKVKKGTKVLTILKWIPVILVFIFLLLKIPFFQTAIKRVFEDVDGYNAIEGRTGQWDNAIGPMHGKKLWYGYGNSKKYKYYLSGLADTIYKYGIVGVILEMFCFLYLMLKRICNFVWCCSICFVLLFCFAHLTSFYEQVFYYGIIISYLYYGVSLKSRIRIKGVL